jgi:hypothetical protein
MAKGGSEFAAQVLEGQEDAGSMICSTSSATGVPAGGMASGPGTKVHAPPTTASTDPAAQPGKCN